MWSEIVKRIDEGTWRVYFEGWDERTAIDAMLAAGDVPGGPTEGITFERLQEGPVRLNVADPDIPFLAQIRDLAPFPPVSLPAPIELTEVFLPTRRIELYKEEDRFLELGEQVVTHKDPYDDGDHDPAEYPLVLLSPHSKWRIHSTYSNNAMAPGDPRRAGRWCRSIPTTRRARGIADDDEIEVFNTRGSLKAWAHVHGRGEARHGHAARGLVEPVLHRGQGRERAHELGDQPDPRGLVRAEHVGAVHRLEGLAARCVVLRCTGDRGASGGRWLTLAQADGPRRRRPKVSPIEALSEASRAYGEIGSHDRPAKLGHGRRRRALHRLLVVRRDLQVRERHASRDVVEPDPHGGRASSTRRAGASSASLDMRWVPLACQHCEDPPCMKVCPTSATVHRRGARRPRRGEPGGLHRVSVLHGRVPLRRAGLQLGRAGVPGPDAPARHGRAAAARLGREVHDVHPPARGAAGARRACGRVPAQARIFGDLNDPDGTLVRTIEDRSGHAAARGEGHEAEGLLPRGAEEAVRCERDVSTATARADRRARGTRLVRRC